MLIEFLTGITLISDTPLPVSDKSRSLSGSTRRASVLFFNIDLDLLWASLEPSIIIMKLVLVTTLLSLNIFNETHHLYSYFECQIDVD